MCGKELPSVLPPPLHDLYWMSPQCPWKAILRVSSRCLLPEAHFCDWNFVSTGAL